MLVVVTHHPVAKGRDADAERMVNNLTEFARKLKGYVSRQACAAMDDAAMLVSITTWRSKEDFEASEQARLNGGPAPIVPAPWGGPIVREYYACFDTAEPAKAARVPPGVTMIAHHYMDPRNDALGRQRLKANTAIARATGGMVRRQLLAPEGDSTKLTSITTFTGEAAQKAWLEGSKQASGSMPQVWTRLESRLYTVKAWG